MKIAFIFVGALAALILIVVIVGALLPKHHVATRSAVYRARAEQLFSLIAGGQSWRPDVKKYEPITSSSGGPQMWRETNSHGETIAYEVIERKSPSLFRTRIATTGLPYSGGWTYALEDNGISTTVRITEEGDVYNPVFRFVSRFIMGHTRSIDAYLNNLAKASGEQIVIKD